MRRLGIYARVSTHEQDYEGSTSIDKQIAAGNLEAHRLGQFDEVEVVKVYEDIGASGALGMNERPEGQRALADARRGKLDTLVCYSMDRFTRSAAKGLADFERLEAAGVDVIFIKENIDTSQPSGRLFRTILAAFAEFEREQIRDRTMAASYARAKKGIWPGGMPPYGYEIDPETGKLVEADIEAPTVRLVFKMRSQGSAILDIKAKLDTMGLVTRRGNPWHERAIRRLLADDRYLGKVVRQYANAGGAEAEEFTYHAPRLVPKKVIDSLKELH